MKTPQEQLNELAERDVLYGQPGCEPVGLLRDMEVAHAQAGDYELMSRTALHDYIKSSLGL